MREENCKYNERSYQVKSMLNTVILIINIERKNYNKNNFCECKLVYCAINAYVYTYKVVNV